MSKVKYAIPALVAGLLVLITGAPAGAVNRVVACNAGDGYRLVGQADFSFTYFLRYELTGGHDKSNVNIQIRRANGTVKWSFESPDNRRAGIEYQIAPPSNIRVEFRDRVSFTGIFDRPIWSDPRCTATTPPWEGDI